MARQDLRRWLAPVFSGAVDPNARPVHTILETFVRPSWSKAWRGKN